MAKRYYLEQEGGDPQSIGYSDIMNVDLADVLYQADEKQLEDILELLDLKWSSVYDNNTIKMYLLLGCDRVTILDVSMRGARYEC